MTTQSTLGASLIALSLVTASAALAGGPTTPKVDVSPVVAVSPAKPAPTLTFSLEETPEFYASAKAGSYAEGSLADEVTKLTVSKALDGGFSVAGSLAYTMREPGTTGVATSFAQAEVTGSYKYKVNATFSLTPSATLGYAFGQAPKISLTDGTASEAYYAVGLAADLKLDSNWTWNVANLRYRDAFSETWRTPRIATGVTYKLDDANVAYASIGKSWKDTGTGLKNDKYSVSFGFKHSF